MVVRDGVSRAPGTAQGQQLPTLPTHRAAHAHQRPKQRTTQMPASSRVVWNPGKTHTRKHHGAVTMDRQQPPTHDSWTVCEYHTRVCAVPHTWYHELCRGIHREACTFTSQPGGAKTPGRTLGRGARRRTRAEATASVDTHSGQCRDGVQHTQGQPPARGGGPGSSPRKTVLP